MFLMLSLIVIISKAYILKNASENKSQKQLGYKIIRTKTSLMWIHAPTQHFAELCVVQVRVLLREPLALILRPHHEGVHGPADPRLALPAALAAGARGARLVLHFGVPERTESVGPLAVSNSRHHD